MENIETPILEGKTKIKAIMTATSENNLIYQIKINNPFVNLKRIIAYMLCWRYKSSRASKVISKNELDYAEVIILKNIQLEDSNISKTMVLLITTVN